jgi:hypothetical protein
MLEGQVHITPISTAHVTHGERLLAVYPVGLTQELKGLRLVIIVIELYKSGFAVNHLVTRTSTDVNHSIPSASSFILNAIVLDNHERVYDANPSIAVGTPSGWRGTIDVQPPLPKDVGVLTIQVKQIQWLIDRPITNEQRYFLGDVSWDFSIKV